MSLRPHGRASVDARSPRAWGVCDRCGFLYNHNQLTWQMEWRGTSLQNIRMLVCPTCLDTPQTQLKRILLPADPVPVQNARPENYVQDNNPLSPVGMSANQFTPTYGTRIGNLTGGGGINSAFDGNINKPAWMCANNSISNSSFGNYVGINWTGNNAVLNLPSSMMPPVLTHSITSFSLYAPNDRGFLGSSPVNYVLQHSAVDIPLWGAWTTFYSGTTTGATGEIITDDCTSPRAQFFRVAFEGDGLTYVAVAQVQFNVGETGEA